MRALQKLSLGCCAAVAVALLPSLLDGVLFSYHPLLMVCGYIGDLGLLPEGDGGMGSVTTHTRNVFKSSTQVS
jgi:hypothetical protein